MKIDTYITDIINGFKVVRMITKAEVIVKRVLRLFDELAKVDSKKVLAGVREAAGGLPND